MKERKIGVALYERKDGKKICPICSKKVALRSSMARHLKIHSGKKNAICEKCPAKFYDNPSLKKHMNRSHIECNVCKKFYGTPKALEDHMNIHTGRTPYRCPFCGVGFTGKVLCNEHKRKEHFEEFGLLKCKYCPKRFNRYNGPNLKEHQETHTAAERSEVMRILQRKRSRRPKIVDSLSSTFTCDVCDEKFTSGMELMTHLMKHQEAEEAQGEAPSSGEMSNKQNDKTESPSSGEMSNKQNDKTESPSRGEMSNKQNDKTESPSIGETNKNTALSSSGEKKTSPLL